MMTVLARETDIQEILDGAVDLHVHPGPSPFPRRISLLDAAVDAADAGFRAIVVKSHHHSMVTDVLAVEAAVGGLPLPVFSGIPLNSCTGGLNPATVDLTLAMGGRVVWFPTISAEKHAGLHEELNFPDPAIKLRQPDLIAVLDDSGELRPEAIEILELIRDNDAILMTGHSDVSVIDALIAGARRVGVERIVVNHPNFVVGANLETCREWARQGVTMEHSLCMYDVKSHLFQAEIPTLLAYLDACGPSHTILGSDLGQAGNPTPVESYRDILAILLEQGVPADVLHQIAAVNGQRLLGV
jgi:hypothetical protein